MAAYFADCAREELVRALYFIRSRLEAVLKEKSNLTIRVDTADVRIDRLTQEKDHLKSRFDDCLRYNKKIVKSYNELSKEHSEVVAEMTAEREELEVENERLVKLARRSDNCLMKTRAAFTELKQQKKAEIDRFVEMGLSVEKRLAEAQAAYLALQRENAEITAQLHCMMAQSNPVYRG